jgi:folate-dependent phosphoribosylglycinamide formyltransferase PurN
MLTVDVARVAVLCSGRAPGLTHLLNREQGRVVGWDIVCCLTSEETFEGEQEAATSGVAIIRHPLRRYYAEHSRHARFDDLNARQYYDEATARLLDDYRPDLVLLSGYLLLLTWPMLAHFPQRIINVHHSDLALRNRRGGPRYPGLRAVRDAILAGERETRSSAHLVTEQVDDGPVLARSQPYAVSEVARWALATGEHDVLRRAIWAHQEWMLRSAFGPLMEQAIERMALLEYAR